jgi:hypothetical protein
MVCGAAAAGVPSGSLHVARGVFGVVPCYSSRVPPLVDRLLPVGDAAANRCASRPTRHYSSTSTKQPFDCSRICVVQRCTQQL